MTQPIIKMPVGISSCLLGQPVRYDGGHKYDALLHSRLGDIFEFRPFCPEVAIGLGTPREPVRLVRTVNGLRAQRVIDPSVDVTTELHICGKQTAADLDDLCGYIFKSRSPSCGMARVKTWTTAGKPDKPDGVGIYAQAIMQALPHLPVIDSDHLHDTELCDNFIERVFACYQLQQHTTKTD